MRLAICVAIKNRSCVIVDKEDSLSFLRHVANKIEDCPQFQINPMYTKENQIALSLFPNMLRSIVKNKTPEDDWVIVVVDYKSTDVNMKEMMEVEVGDKMPWHLEVVEDYPFFDRGGGLAKAVAIAETTFQADAVLFSDADLYFTSRELFVKAIESVSKGQFFYPIVFSFALADHSKGVWRDSGFGIFACRIADYKKTDGWCHNVSWGWEDRALADSIPETRKDREKISGYFHQWHPLQWEFRVREYPVKEFVFKKAAVKELIR
jgi:glycosyltransferase involved in cell wall biosynthesis